MKKCTSCGKEQPDEATTCPLDGEPLVPVTVAQATSLSQPSHGIPPVIQPQKPLSSLVLIGLFFSAFLGVSYLYLTGYMITNPKLSTPSDDIKTGVLSTLLLAIPISVWISRTKRRKELERLGVYQQRSNHLICPKCGKTDIRRPLRGWRGVITSIALFFVGSGIIQGLMPENQIKNFQMEMIKDTVSTMVFVASLWFLFSAFFGKNRCKACKYRWK